MEEHALERDTLLTTLPTLGLEWNISHEFRPTEYPGGWRNSLHLTIGGNSGEYGDRIVAIWPSSRRRPGNMFVMSAVSGDSNYIHYSLQPPMGVWTNIQVSQTLEDERYMYRIVVGGEEVHAVENTEPAEFENVKVYASNPWYDAQPGSIRNLVIESAVQGESVVFRLNYV